VKYRRVTIYSSSPQAIMDGWHHDLGEVITVEEMPPDPDVPDKKRFAVTYVLPPNSYDADLHAELAGVTM
jgi:hypothetical protein